MSLVVRPAGPAARAHPAGGRPPVRRGRRAALVARAVGPRHAHPLFRRPALAALRGGALCRGDGRRRHPAGGRPVPRRRRRSCRARSRRTCSPARPPSRRPSWSTASAPWSGASRPARTACPLIGSGDWNDGMNRVGQRGSGRKRVARLVPATRCCSKLGAALCERGRPAARASATPARPAGWRPCSELAWDGDWYRRGYYDDGSPLGSAQNDECKIDSICADLGRALRRRPLGARGAGHGRGPHPPRAAGRAGGAPVHAPVRSLPRRIPGYIKGYPPGVRENGGQYTHAAIWTIMAVGPARQRRRGDGAVPHAEPDQPHAHRRRCGTLQGRSRT